MGNQEKQSSASADLGYDLGEMFGQQIGTQIGEALAPYLVGKYEISGQTGLPPPEESAQHQEES